MRDKKHTKLHKTLCCSCRYSSASSLSEESENSSDRFASISSLAHALVQERLDQMITERREARKRRKMLAKEKNGGSATKFVVVVAMEKSSYEPREDFRDSMVEMITANKIEEPNDLRRLLNYYISMNSEEYSGLILEVFHDVCTKLFSRCKFRC